MFSVQPIEFATPEFDEAVGLRYEVLRRPLGLEYSPEQLAAEYDQFHLAAFDAAGRIVGYLNLTPKDAGEVKMRQVAVAPDWQGRGVGLAMVQFAEQWAREKDFSLMTLHARLNAVPFYQKLDYEREGDPFEEVTIPHFYMKKTL